MKGTKILLSFWLSTATFCLLQVLFGPGGLSETARLREQNTRLDTRLTALRDENARLTARYESLRTSAEAIRLEARALGYFRPGDTPVRTLDGAQFRLPPDAPDMASVPHLSGEGADSRWFFRIAMPLLFGLFYSLLHLIERLKPSKAMLPAIRPSPRLNLPAPFSTGLDFFRK